MLDQTSGAVWVQRMLSRENAVRRPRRDESDPPEGVARLFVEAEGLFHAMAELSRRPGIVELDCVIVDPSSRGTGLARSVVNKAHRLWSTDPILSGRSVEETFIPLPLVALTRDAAMANVLIQSGFHLVTPRRTWRSLWLFRTRFTPLPLRTAWYLHIRWLMRVVKWLLIGEPLPEGARRPEGLLNRWFQRRRRPFTMMMHAGSSKVFMTNPPSTSETTKTSEGESIATLDSIHVHVVEREVDSPPNISIEDWDIGRQIETPDIIDLTEE